MKYIRTKDGKIFTVLVSDQVSKDEVAMDIIGFRIQTALKQNKCIAKKDNILKIADTIEELCDEFVVVPDQDIKPFIATDFIRNGNSYVCADIYGAIYTDKGLIYVAKMNNKGELELL